MYRKQRKGSSWNRDMTGRPVNRSKAWGERKGKDPKKDRRNWQKEMKGITI